MLASLSLTINFPDSFGGFELELNDRFIFMAEYNPLNMKMIKVGPEELLKAQNIL